MITKLVSAALVAAALTAAPASAQEAPASQTSVNYADLNLGAADGRAALERRIRGAARIVCGAEQAPGLAEHMAVQSCRTQTMAAAAAQVNQVLASRGSGSITVAARR